MADPARPSLPSLPSLSGGPTLSNLVVRPVTPGDAPAIAALTAELGYARTEPDIARWIAQLEELTALAAQHGSVIPAQAVLVACQDDLVLGWIQVEVQRHLQEADRALIAGLVVSSSVRGQGIGRLLCRAAEDWARAHGIAALRVTSRSTRERAHRFYLRDGYLRVKTSEVFEKPLA